jgi:hypothetical protein
MRITKYDLCSTTRRACLLRHATPVQMCKYSYPSYATGVLENPALVKVKALLEIGRKEIAAVKLPVP